MFYAVDVMGISRARLLTRVVQVIYSPEIAAVKSDSWYVIHVCSTKKFLPVPQYFDTEFSFFQMNNVTSNTNKLLGVESKFLFSEGFFCRNPRFEFVTNL